MFTTRDIGACLSRQPHAGRPIPHKASFIPLGSHLSGQPQRQVRLTRIKANFVRAGKIIQGVAAGQRRPLRRMLRRARSCPR